jgi:hypothetical protein
LISRYPLLKLDGNGLGQQRAQGQAGGSYEVAPNLHRGLLGLAAASVAVTMAVSEPPPGLDGNAYFVALPAAAGVFFAGMNQVLASVWSARGDDRRHVAGRRSSCTPWS